MPNSSGQNRHRLIIRDRQNHAVVSFPPPRRRFKPTSAVTLPITVSQDRRRRRGRCGSRCRRWCGGRRSCGRCRRHRRRLRCLRRYSCRGRIIHLDHNEKRGLEAGVISVIMLPLLPLLSAYEVSRLCHILSPLGVSPQKKPICVSRFEGLSRCPAALRSCHPLQACRPRAFPL